MKSLETAMQDILASGAATLATCWALHLRDGSYLRFVDADVDVVVAGNTYSSSPAFARTAISTSAGLALDNLEVKGFLSSDAITEADLVAGRYDGAEIEVFVVDYTTPSAGTIPLAFGRLGEIVVDRSAFSATLYSLSALLQQVDGEQTSPICRAVLGDARCGATLTPTTGTVTGVTSRFSFASTVSDASGLYTDGLLTWTAGANNGREIEVRLSSGSALTLVLEMPSAIAIGDTFSLTPGCGHTYTDCVSKFANGINFQAEPHLPGLDRMLNP